MAREKKSALQKATDLLAGQEQSSSVLRQKLLARKYNATEVDDALAKLKRYKYIDDEEACRRQFENFYAEGKLSVRQIVVKLIQRGFDQNFIERLIPDDVDEHERTAAEKLLAKKFLGTAKFDRIKAWQFLASRGFDSDIIAAAVERQCAMRNS